MGLRYFKRFRMELDLTRLREEAAVLPDGYVWTAWNQQLIARHAKAKFSSFHDEIDTLVFPCLGNLAGCQKLIKEIANRDTFLPEATWLISRQSATDQANDDCGTIQGLAQRGAIGAIQNVGISPAHRGFGLGRALVLKSLAGFQQARMRRVFLEVTADNEPAVELYRSIGFRLTRTLYKAVPIEPHSV